MAAKIWSPFITRLRRSVNGERLSENYTSYLELRDDVSEIIVNGNTFTQNREFSEPGSETSSVINTAITRTENDLHILAGDEPTTDKIEDTWDLRIVNRSKTKRFAVLGIVLAIAASLLFSATSLMIKLAESIPSLEVVSMRLALQLVFAIPPVIFFNDKLAQPWKKIKFVVLRGAVGATAMNLSIYAVKHMPLADARVIFYTSPVYTALFGRIFLKETVTKFDLIATLLSLGGVVLIGRPTFLFGSLGKSSSSKEVWFPTLLAVFGAFCAAGAIVLSRKVSQEMAVRVVVLYSTSVGLVITLAASMIAGGFKYPDCGTYDAIYIIVSGVLGYSAQLIVTKALSLEKASVISLARTIGIAFSFLFQITILAVAPNGFSIGGALLVLLCNVTIFIKKLLDQKKKVDQF